MRYSRDNDGIDANDVRNVAEMLRRRGMENLGDLGDDVPPVPGVITKDMAERRAREVNEELGYSKKLPIFKPLNIEMLVNLSNIDPTILDYPDSELEKGEVCQMCMDPGGMVSVGYFNKYGSGTCYHIIRDPKEFVEGVHFKFVD